MTDGTAGRTPRAGAGPGLGDRVAEATAAAAAELATACVGVALLWVPQERIVWQPPRLRPRDRVAPAGATRLDYVAADGQPLLAWAVEPLDGRPPVGTLLAFHGNAELAVWGVPWARDVAARTGWRVVLAEYRGYAELGGTPAYRTSALDAWAAYEAAARDARAADGAPAPHVLFGHSLGSAVAAELAATLAAVGRPPGALVLQSPFTSVRAMARVGAWPGLDGWWRRIARVGFDTAARVAALEVPVWVAHGVLDVVVPVRMGRQVFAAARRPGALLVVPGAGHNRVPARGGARYWQWLGNALAAAAVELSPRTPDPQPPRPCSPSSRPTNSIR